MQRKNAPSVFLSYSHSDKVLVDSVRKGLRKFGARLTDEKLGLGEVIFSGLKQSLSDSDIVVFFVPPHEGSGQWALAELGAAKALDKNVIAVLPDRKRFRNSNSLSSLFDHQVLDATGLSGTALAERIMENAVMETAA